jgi:RNA processing factor Prp31
MNLSKRTLILTAVAILGVIAAVFSVYMEKREAEKINEEIENEFNEIAEAEPKPPRKSKTVVSEPEKPVKDEADTVKE